MKKKIKLQAKLTILIIIVVFISISIVIFFATSWINRNIEETAKINVMNVAEMIANSKEIIDELRIKDPNKKISKYIDTQLKNLDKIEYIIVVDNDGIRYSHPNSNIIGEKFVGGDEFRVIKEGDTYISQGTGTLGNSLRAFVPIYDKDSNKVIGFVCVGTLVISIGQAKNMAVLYIILTSSFGLIVGIIGAFILANNIKKILLGLEPEEITRLYNEKIGILHAINEGLIAIDNEGKITLINDSALNILHYGTIADKNHLIGKDIQDIFPTMGLMTVLQTGKSEFEKAQRIHNILIMTNIIPISHKGKILGVIATFRDKTEVTRLAEELTGIEKMTWSLRAQNHEFMNKLHTITGLIQLEEYDEALEFISDVAKSRNNISSILNKKIHNPYLQGLLLSKYNKAEENRVKFKIDENSILTRLPEYMTSEEIVSIVGNLIENSLDAVSNDGTGEIYVKIVQFNYGIQIIVKDNGPGIKEEYRDKIYNYDFTTKVGQRGHGMYIVKNIIDASNGIINFQVTKGVTWNIIIPMVRSE